MIYLTPDSVNIIQFQRATMNNHQNRCQIMRKNGTPRQDLVVVLQLQGTSTENHQKMPQNVMRLCFKT